MRRLSLVLLLALSGAATAVAAPGGFEGRRCTPPKGH